MSKAKKIADMAIFLAIGIVINIASFPVISYFGRISFVYSLCYLTGILYGPVGGFIIASLADIIPAFILPQGVWIPLITVSVGLIAMIMGLSNKYLKGSLGFRLVIGAIVAYLVCTCVLTPLGEVALFNTFPYTFAKSIGKVLKIESPFVMLMISKAITQSVWVSLNAGITYLICVRLKSVINYRFGEHVLRLKNIVER